MIIPPGSESLAEVLTFPGVILRQTVTQLVCRWWGLRVYTSRYFHFEGKHMGLLQHDEPQTTRQAWALVVYPFLLCSLAGILVAWCAVLQYYLGLAGPADWLLLWLGVSFATRSFPPRQYVERLRELLAAAEAREYASTKQLYRPFTWLLHVAALFHYSFISLPYALFVCIVLPWFSLQFV